MQRTNVALSRAKQRLVVVASQSMVHWAPSGWLMYRQLGLWKALLGLCRKPIMAGTMQLAGGEARSEYGRANVSVLVQAA